MNFELLIKIVCILFSITIIFQSIENLLLKNIFDNKNVSIWDWGILSHEFEFLPLILRKLAAVFLNNKGFFYLLLLRLLTSIFFLFMPSALGALIIFLTTLLISIRFRGSFNGGSDYMSLILSGALSFLLLFQNDKKIALGCLWYIAIQVTLSYLFSGIAKIKKKEWRNGEALTLLISNPHYAPPLVFKKLLSNAKIALGLSWLIILFEISFPIIFIAAQFLKPFLIAGFLFHLSNFFALGLNRFFWIWMTSYPVLFFLVLDRY